MLFGHFLLVTGWLLGLMRSVGIGMFIGLCCWFLWRFSFSTNLMSIWYNLFFSFLKRKWFTSNLVWGKIPPTHYLVIDKIIYVYFWSHDLFNKSCDLFK